MAGSKVKWELQYCIQPLESKAQTSVFVPDVAGSLKHIVIDRDTVLRRMAFGADETETWTET
jgi:hypothetical protein